MTFIPETDIPALFNDIDNVLRVSRNNISSLSGVPSGSVSKASAGQRDFTHGEYVRVRAIVDDLLAIQARFAPAKLDWSDVRATKKLLEDLHRERAHPVSLLTQDEAHLLHEFATTDDVHQLAIDNRMSRGELLLKIEELLGRSRRLVEAAK